MRLEVQGAKHCSAGADFDDGDCAKPEVEVPEMVHREAQQDAHDDPKDAAVGHDQGPGSPVRGVVAVAEDLVAVVCARRGALSKVVQKSRSVSYTHLTLPTNRE